MITYKILRRKQDCGLCEKNIPKWDAAFYDHRKPVEKRYVHAKCYIDLMKSRGQYKEPPF